MRLGLFLVILLALIVGCDWNFSFDYPTTVIPVYTYEVIEYVDPCFYGCWDYGVEFRYYDW